MQESFNPIDYHFEWDNDWYKWDSEAGRKTALRLRNRRAKRLAAQGISVHKWTLRDQVATRGGIGSGHPEITAVVNCYMLDWC